MRVLPRDPFARMAWVWLIYLVFLVRPAHLDAATIGGTIAGVLVFAPLYFRGYQVEGRQALVPIVGIALIGMLLFPLNHGASVFFVFAAAFAGRAGGIRTAAAIVAGLVLAMSAEMWALSLQWDAWAWPLVITILIGAVMTYSIDTRRRLDRAQEEAHYMAIIAERERIGRDLHDLLGHTLSVIALKAELASKLASRDPEQSLVEIRDVERISREALADVRNAVQASRTVVLSEELRGARTALEAARIALSCDASPITVDPARERALALALREGVTNVIRHSRARLCEIKIKAADGVAHLEIVDDGIGGNGAEGSGLSGMRVRVMQLGGRLERIGDHGTRLTITLPLVSAPAETPA